METILTDLFKLLIPALLVLIAVYLMVTTMLTKDFEKKVLDLRQKNQDLVLPIRLQAYERVVLFLERISLHNLILRVNNPMFTVIDLQQQMLQEIREEFGHNLSQQVYMTDEAWDVTRNAMEEIIGLINTSAQQLSPEAPGIELAKKIFEQQMNAQVDPISRALKIVKDEIRQVF
jgi:predicted AlkP superfamily phosphohydrolase/phosphomutase